MSNEDEAYLDGQAAASLLQPFVDDVNAQIFQINQLEGKQLDPITAGDIYLPMLETFVKEAKHSTLSEMLLQSNPHLAIELGLLTLREAIREGAIPLTKEHVLGKVIAYRELPREAIEALEFTQEEYRELGR